MKMPYFKITVTEICREAHLSRKTFYDNFQDKEEILEAIFEDDVVKPILTMNSLLSVNQSRDLMEMYMQNVYTPICNDKEFYQRLVRPMKGVDDTFIRVVTNSLEKLNHHIMADVSSAEGVERDDGRIPLIGDLYTNISDATSIGCSLCDDCGLSPPSSLPHAGVLILRVFTICL